MAPMSAGQHVTLQSIYSTCPAPQLGHLRGSGPVKTHGPRRLKTGANISSKYVNLNYLFVIWRSIRMTMLFCGGIAFWEAVQQMARNKGVT